MKNKIIAICAILKDEHQYLKEWVDYHLSIGIDYIYLYEDINSITHIDIVENYDNVFLQSLDKFIDLNHCLGKQFKLYNKFMTLYKDIIDYTFFIDIDEFVAFAEDYTIEDLIKQCDEWGGVLLPWKHYGACGHIDNPKTDVMSTYNTYTKIEFPKNKNTCHLLSKSFVKMNVGKMIHHHIHSTAKPIVSYDSEDLYTKCWINHYITKSWEEWCIRLFVKGQLMTLRQLDEFFKYNPDMIHLKDELYNKEYCKDKQLLVANR